MGSLPSDIIVHILSKVPVMELGGLKCVCKSWKEAIIDNRQALHLHGGSPSQSNSMMSNLLLIMRDDRDPRDMFCTYLTNCDCEKRGFRQNVSISKNVMGSSFEIVGSCNGLLCLLDGETRSRILVMNPLTNQSMCLPNLDLIIDRQRQYVVSCGFGYNSDANSYNVVVIVEAVGHNESEAIMFDCKANSYWRSIRKIPLSFLEGSSEFDLAIFLDGRLHWFTDRKIVSLDLINEKFTFTVYPFNRRFCHLTVFSFVRQFPRGTPVLEIWECNDEEVWGTIVHFFQLIEPGTTCFEVLGEVKNGKILIKRDDTMLLYDPTSKQLKSLGYQRLPKGSTPIIHFPTLDWPLL